jgi:phosphatidylglycerophosphate synthase
VPQRQTNLDGNSHVLPRALLIDAGMKVTLLGGGLLAAAFAVARVTGLGWQGGVIALALYGAVGGLVLLGLRQHAPHRRFGPANAVTLARAACAALFLGIVGQGAPLGAGERWGLALAGGTALLFDGVDGWAARRSGLASPFGARFDMEVDALFVLALSALVWFAGQAGAWVLTSGAMRYIFVFTAWLWPPLGAPLPPSRQRKAVCVVQLVVLAFVLAPPVDRWTANLLCAGGLGLLVYSFGADYVWLARSWWNRREVECLAE